MRRGAWGALIGVWLLVRLTYYLPTGNATTSGLWPAPGHAACSYNLALGTRLMLPDGLPLVCTDRGDLEWSGWIDVYVLSDPEGRALIARYGDWTHVWIEDDD